MACSSFFWACCFLNLVAYFSQTWQHHSSVQLYRPFSFRYLYNITQWTNKRTRQQTIRCYIYSFVLQKRLLYKGLSHSEFTFDHELFTGLSLTSMHSLNFRFQFWNPQKSPSLKMAQGRGFAVCTFFYYNLVQKQELRLSPPLSWPLPPGCFCVCYYYRHTVQQHYMFRAVVLTDSVICRISLER